MSDLMTHLRQWLETHMNPKMTIFICLALVAFAFYGGQTYHEWNKENVGLTPVKDTSTDSDSSVKTDAEEPSQNTAAKEVVVHVTGAVSKPGVYTLPSNARVDDAVRAAAATDKADFSQLNLAQKLNDGQKIIVPAIGEIQSTESTNPSTSKTASGKVTASANETTGDGININSAALEELQELPGIGEVRAEAIITHRETNGPFQTIEDLQEVSGIGEKTYAKIAPYITV